jgi:DNA-binding transcriptional LysR family regulator
MSGEANCLLGARLQIKLLQRSTPSLALTDLGARYIERCKDVLDAVAEGYSQTTDAFINSRGRSRQSCMSGRRIQAAVGVGRRFLPAQAQNPGSRSQSLW